MRNLVKFYHLPYPVLGGIEELCELDGEDDDGVPLFAKAGKSKSKLLTPVPIGWFKLSEDPVNKQER